MDDPCAHEMQMSNAMLKTRVLQVESKVRLDPNSELKSTFLIHMTHPSLEETLDKINLRVTNPREILDNKKANECLRHGMMVTMFPPIDIHEETTLEPEKEDGINEHGSYFINTPLLMVTNTHFDHQHSTQKHGKAR